MNKKISVLLSLAGLLILFVALFADYLGLGDVDPDHFTIGTKQIAGMVAGVAIFLFGILMWKKSKK